MVKVLITGDTHIPTRARTIPDTMRKVIEENKPYYAVFFTGDLISENMLKFVKSLSKRAYIVQGNMDYLSLPEEVVTEVADIKIGMIHGHQIYPRGNIDGLTRIAKEMNVQILINGHTHYAKIIQPYSKSIVLVNPGSLTGVWSGGYASMRPSLIIGFFEINNAVFRLYELYGAKLEIREYIFTL